MILFRLKHWTPTSSSDLTRQWIQIFHVCYTNIIGEIKHYFRDKRNIVKIPRKLQTHSKIKRFIKENIVDENKSPSEIAKNLEIAEEIVLECFEA